MDGERLSRSSSAQLLTLNQRVQGSNPCTPTNKIRHLEGLRRKAASQKSRLGSTWEARATLSRRRSRFSVAGHTHFFASELGFGVSCLSSRTSSGKLSATNITAAVTSPTVIPSHQ
jgi:hypothetical protein